MVCYDYVCKLVTVVLVFLQPMLHAEAGLWFISIPSCQFDGVRDLYVLHCNGTDTIRLHCLLDDFNQSGITCTPWKWIYDGYCPYYNHDQQRIDQRLCSGNSSVCPSDVQGGQYASHQVYKYPACLQKSSEPDQEEGVTCEIQMPNAGVRYADFAVGGIWKLAYACLLTLLIG